METEPVPQFADPVPDHAIQIEPDSKAAPSGAPVQISDQFWSLDPRNIQAGRISGFIFSAVVLCAAVIGLMIAWANLGFHVIWIGIAIPAAVICMFIFLMSLFWPAIEHRYASWRLDAEGLEIRRGVFWQHQITIPLGRVQHADVSQGPLQRQLGLGTLTIHTAGTQNASVGLEGLAHETAIELRDEIVRQRKDQNVV